MQYFTVISVPNCQVSFRKKIEINTTFLQNNKWKNKKQEQKDICLYYFRNKE